MFNQEIKGASRQYTQLVPFLILFTTGGELGVICVNYSSDFGYCFILSFTFLTLTSEIENRIKLDKSPSQREKLNFNTTI